MTHPEIPEEAVERATIAWYEATPGVSWADAGKYERAAMLARSKLILEAGFPHLRARIAGHTYGDGTHYPPTGGAHVVERCIATCPPAPRPVVDRKALAAAYRSHYSQHGPGISSGGPFQARCRCGAEYGHGGFADHFADVILALLPTEEDTNASCCTCRTVAPSGWDTVQHVVDPSCPLHTADTKGEGS